MNRNTAIALGVGATIVLVGGGLALAGGGKKGKKKAKGGFVGDGSTPWAKPSKDPKPVLPKPGRGLTVSVGCQLKITDLAKAKATAYKVGRAASSLAEGQQNLWDFGTCGVTAPLKTPKDTYRSLYQVEYELYRGLLEVGAMERQTGEILLRARQMEMALAGVSTSGLEGKLPW